MKKTSEFRKGFNAKKMESNGIETTSMEPFDAETIKFLEEIVRTGKPQWMRMRIVTDASGKEKRLMSLSPIARN